MLHMFLYLMPSCTCCSTKINIIFVTISVRKTSKFCQRISQNSVAQMWFPPGFEGFQCISRRDFLGFRQKCAYATYDVPKDARRTLNSACFQNVDFRYSNMCSNDTRYSNVCRLLHWPVKLQHISSSVSKSQPKRINSHGERRVWTWPKSVPNHLTVVQSISLYVNLDKN